jgi:hypothetical protein
MKVPSHRTKKRITLDEYKQLIGQGLSNKQIIDTGVSKHQVSLLSALLQNRIGITKEQFEQEYRSGRQLVEIADAYHIPRDLMASLREHFQIGRLGATFLRRKRTEKPLTFRQKKIIYGSLMGDCGKMSPSSIKMKHSLAQKDYVEWKFEELKEHVTERGLQIESNYSKERDVTYEYAWFYTHANTDIEEIVTKFYKPNKQVSMGVLNELDPLSIAVWYMDDGSTDRGHVSPGARDVASLCTDSFTLAECEMIVQWFGEKWDIKSYTRLRKRDADDPVEKYRIIFGTDETAKLFDLIRPYVIPSMMYKLGV